MRFLIVFIMLLTMIAGCVDPSAQNSPPEAVTVVTQALENHGPESITIFNRTTNTVPAAYSIFDNPHNGRLYAAAGYAIITPNDENHPGEKYMGGTSHNRIANGAHDDLEARVLVLQQNERHLVLVSLDLVGWALTDTRRVADELEQLGVNRDSVIISSTHTHSSPDTMGVWGPDFFLTGRCPVYADFLVDTITNAVIELSAQMVSVTVRAAETAINIPEAPVPNLMRDSRYPHVYNEHLVGAILTGRNGHTVATVVNWQIHPEVFLSLPQYSADFPRWTRKKLEEHFGGTAIYFSGTVGGLLTCLGVPVPEYTEAGEPVLEEGEPVFITSTSDAKCWSYGYVVADWIIQALENAPEVGNELFIDSKSVLFPFKNPYLIYGVLFGLIEGIDDIVTDHPWFCGVYGCMPQSIIHAQIGTLHFITLPGEAVSETSVGREETVNDFGGDFGEFIYPAMTGYRESLPEGHLLMDIGLANNEIGYIIPRSDYHGLRHPDFYEEGYSISRKSEELMRDAIVELLSRSNLP